MSLERKLRQLEAELDKLDIDDPNYDRLNDQANALAEEIENVKSKAEQQIILQHQKRKLQERLNEAQARIQAKVVANEEFHDVHDVHDWYSWAKSLYPIEETNNQYIVHSTAKEWSDEAPKYWVCSSEAEAWEKIDQLIDWKIKDRNRGFGSMEEDLTRN